MTSQWDSLRKNVGVWQGAFVQFSPQGQQVGETPSTLTLEESEPGQTMELVLERSPRDEPKKVNNLTFTAPGPGAGTTFFESGAFAQGASQWSAFGQFATEFSLKVGNDKRVRYVVMYESTQSYTSTIKFVTLICEHREGSAPFTEKTLDPAQLKGKWTGNTSIIFTDGKEPTTGSSQWQLQPDLTFSCREQWANTDHAAHMLEGNGSIANDTNQDSESQQNTVIQLAPSTDGQLTYQLMLLPKGAYCLLPKEIKREKAFRIEVGWIKNSGERPSSEGVARVRFIRYYDTRGVHTDSALIEDQHTL